MEDWVIRNLKKIKGMKEIAGVFSLYDIIVKVEAKDQSTLEQIKQNRYEKYNTFTQQ